MNPHVAHRGGLETRLERLFPDPGLFGRMGGRDVVSKLIEELYDRIEADPALEPKFVNDTRLERSKQKKFFEEWLGGEALYSQHVAQRGLREIHEHIHISAKDASRWLGHFDSAMEAAGVVKDLREEVHATLRPLARTLVNETREATRYEHRCHRSKPRGLAEKAARQGKPELVMQLLDSEARRNEWGSVVLFAAAERGRLDVVRRLLDEGVDPNAAAPTNRREGFQREGFQTPLSGARRKRKPDVCDLLRERGAVDDIFSEATLGDLAGVEAWLGRDPTLLDAVDPAQDIYRLGVLHHAVLAGQEEVALFLLERGAGVGPLGSLLVRVAAEAELVATVESLLEHGADATRIGCGRWVLHPELAPMLHAHGADVNYAPDPHSSWIWQACTGNHAQKDDPAYVQALIAHGADVTTTHGWGRSALHFASKAGFAEVVRILLAAGADPNQRDERDAQTPLFHAFKAGKSVDPTIVASILLEHGADPRIEDRLGKTVVDRHPRATAIL